VKARKVKGLDPDAAFADDARKIVAVRVDELYALAPKALDVERPRKLHDLRIAAKRLRYVLEIARPALGPGATDGVRTAKALQQLLGDIHDCDEMLPRVQDHLARLRAEDVEELRRRAGRNARDLKPSLAAQAPNADRYRGLETLAAHLAARRQVLFARFEREWVRLEARDFRGTLLAAISPPEPEAPALAAGAAR
jgi:CHAD domain-containing protein